MNPFHTWTEPDGSKHRITYRTPAGLPSVFQLETLDPSSGEWLAAGVISETLAATIRRALETSDEFTEVARTIVGPGEDFELFTTCYHDTTLRGLRDVRLRAFRDSRRAPADDYLAGVSFILGYKRIIDTKPERLRTGHGLLVQGVNEGPEIVTVVFSVRWRI